MIAAAYFVAGKLSLFLSIPPGFATPVWPSAGIALAAILIFGYRYLPGVFIGSFATNLMVALDAGALVSTLTPHLVAAGIAVGAVLQATLGAWLVKRTVSIPTTFNHPKEPISLLIGGGIFGCIVNAIIGPWVLFIADVIPGEIYFTSVFTWWVGDVIGVILFAPMLLLVANKANSNIRKFIVGGPVIVFTAIALLSFLNIKESQFKDKQNAFEVIARDIATEFEKDIEVYLNILAANERFINASNYVSGEEFEVFTRGFLKHHSSIQSLSWNPKVTYQERKKHEKEIQDQGFPDYVIKDRFGIGEVKPAEKRDVYFPVTYLAPYDVNKAAHGFDTYGMDKVVGNLRHKVLNQSRDEDKPITTGRISLVQAENQYGLLIYNPVYSNELKDDTVASRRKHLIGYTAGVFIMPTMLSGVVELADKLGAHVVLRDLNMPLDKQLLYDSRTINHQEPQEEMVVPDEALYSDITFKVAGHTWELTFIQKSENIIADQGWYLWYLLIGGLLFSAIFGVFLIVVSSNAEEIQKEIGEIEEEGGYKKFPFVTNISGVISAFWFAGLVAIIMMMFSIALWQQFKSQEKKLLQTVINEEIEAITKTIYNNMNSTVVALQRMAQRWEISGGTPLDQWHADAKHYVEDFEALTTVEWVDNTYHVRLIEPLEGNEKAMGLNIAFDEERKKVLKDAAKKHSITLTPPLDLVQGYRAVITYVPIHTKEHFDGFMVGIYNADTLLKDLFPDEQLKLLNIKIRDGEKIIFQDVDEVSQSVTDSVFITEKTITLFNRHWSIMVSPKKLLIEGHASILPTVVVLSGGLFSLLVGFIVYISILSNQRSKLLKKNAVALRESEGRLSAILETAPDGILSVDHKGVIKSLNQEVSSIFGYEEEELIGQNVTLLLPQEKHRQHAIDVGKFARSGSTKVMGADRKVVGIHKDGHEIYLEIGLSRTVMPDGSINIIASVRDITQRLQSEAKLKELSERMTLILENAGEGVFGLDVNGYTTFANKAAEDMLGFTIEEMVNASQHDLIHHHYADGREYPKEACNIYQALKDGKTHREDKEVFWTKNGIPLPVEYSSKPIYNDEGDITGAVVVFRDITERKQAEEKIQKANKEIETFTYIASHDLRSPLINLRGFTLKINEYIEKLKQIIEKVDSNLTSEEQKLANELLKEKIPQAEKFIHDGVTRIDNITSSMLQLSRTGRRELLFKKLKTHEIVNRCANAVSHQLGDGCVSIEKLPDIVADEASIEQIFGNLFDNAVKYLEPERVGKLEISCEQTLTHYKFKVKDNGRGIAKNEQDKVFAIFRRAGNVINDTQGEGMGLSHVKTLIERHGGNIWFESELGEGTTFFFTIDKNLQY